MKYARILLPVMAMMLVLCGCGVKNSIVTKPIDTPVIQVAPINPGISTEKLKSIIIGACSKYGWMVNSATSTNVEATLNHNRETVTIDIPYSNEKVEIIYKSSNNMRYDGNKIHRSYNRWIKSLEVDIRNGIASAR